MVAGYFLSRPYGGRRKSFSPGWSTRKNTKAAAIDLDIFDKVLYKKSISTGRRI
jgi:hypothetical protein